jgi:hypothetical protein
VDISNGEYFVFGLLAVSLLYFYAVTPSDSLIDTMGEPFKVDMFIACDSTLVDPVHSVCCVYVCDCDTVEIVW